jgi:hypothetical protein
VPSCPLAPADKFSESRPHVCWCDGFRLPARSLSWQQGPGPAGRRSKAAREGRRGIGAPVSAGAMGIWSAPSVQQGPVEADISAPYQRGRVDPPSDQHRHGPSRELIDATTRCQAMLGPSVIAAGREPAGRMIDNERRYGGDHYHDVSIPISSTGALGRWCGVQPPSNVSMMIIRPPQQGQGWAGFSAA